MHGGAWKVRRGRKWGGGLLAYAAHVPLGAHEWGSHTHCGLAHCVDVELVHGKRLEQGDGGQVQQGDGEQVRQGDGRATAQWLLPVCHGGARRLPLRATPLWEVGRSCSHHCSLGNFVRLILPDILK